MEYAIETNHLSKKYQNAVRVNQINMRVLKGSVYGFLGPNGAGKSTTMKMLLGLARPTGGSIRVLGHALNEKNRLSILAQTGSLIEAPSFYSHLSGYENLEIVQTLRNSKKKEIEEVLSIVRLSNQKNKKVGQYSLGMKQRLGIAAALIGKPSLLLLDEPTNGLDPAGIQEIRELLTELPKCSEMTILISSHLLSEIDQMVTEVGIIDQGELIYQDTLKALHAHGQSRLLLRTMDNSLALRILQEHQIPAASDMNRIILPYMPDQQLAKSIRLLLQHDIDILRLEEEKKSLEDIFLELTGRRVTL